MLKHLCKVKQVLKYFIEIDFLSRSVIILSTEDENLIHENQPITSTVGGNSIGGYEL